MALTLLPTVDPTLRRVFMTDEQIAAVYRTHVAEETRAQVSEAQFILYHRAEAADAWLCRFDFPYDFAIGPTTYDPTRQQAVIKVATRRRTEGVSPATTSVETFSYRVLKESGLWKVALPPEMVRHLTEWRPVNTKRFSLARGYSMSVFFVGVHSVELDVSWTRLEAAISNRGREVFALDKILQGAMLTDRWGRRYAQSSVRGTRPPAGKTLQPQSEMDLELDFSPLPLESRRFVLSATDPTMPPLLGILPKYTVRVDLGCP